MRRLLDSQETPALPPARPILAGYGDGNGNGNGAAAANFDSNMVIILAALLCALICALGLNSIARCALRCSRRLAEEAAEHAAAAARPSGLKKRALRRMPVEVYGAGAGVFAGTDCAICLGEFADGEKVRVLPTCHHGFHVRCIDTWLAAHSSCPTCRSSLLDRAAKGGVGQVPQPGSAAAAAAADAVR